VKPIFVIVVLGVLGAAIFSGCNRETTVTNSPELETLAASNAPVAVAQADHKYDKLKGRWERPDGGYVIEVRSADAEGRLEAGYFNPAPVKVAQARAYQEGGLTKVFVELRDENYPGCTYKLTYDAQSDQLFGQYFQATMQQTYDVTFGRLK
jgi:hypothetical protein